MSLLWLLLIAPADRLVGTGWLSRLISLPLASAIIGICLVLAMGVAWWWSLVFAALFALGRGPNVANGFKAVDNLPIDPARDGWDTRWFSAFTGGNSSIWGYYRIFFYYAPFFIAISPTWGISADVAYALCWAACYRFVRPVWGFLRLPEFANFTTFGAETAECICFAGIIAILAS